MIIRQLAHIAITKLIIICRLTALLTPQRDFCPAQHGLLKISEGKFHQIKRMFAALGNEVVALHRRSIHGLTLDPNLPEGECRYLTAEEIQGLEDVN